MEGASISHSKVKKKERDSLLLSDLQISAAAAQGGRRYMEDRLQIEVGRDANGGLDFIFAAIYDGHGGVQASDYALANLFQNIVNNQAFYSNDDNEVLDAIRSGFLSTQINMHKVSEQWPPTSTGFPCTAGTTATCAIIRNGKLFTGHVGDSSIILANFLEDEAGFHDAKLTADHKPESKAERIRIEKAGGAIASKSGIFRVVWKRPILRGHRGPVRRSTCTENIPFLAVARSLGDFWSFNSDNNQYVISPDPDVDVFRLKDTDNYIIIASDGLTNVLSIQSIIGILRDEKKATTSPFADGGNKNEQQNLPVNCAHSLLQNAFKKWGSLRADNISIICIKLNADEVGDNNALIAEGNVGGMEVGQQLIDHPYSLIHVNQMRTFRLNTNPIRHLYTGSVDKGMKWDHAIRMGNHTVNVFRNNSNPREQEQFTGPGFISPEMPNNELPPPAAEVLDELDQLFDDSIESESDAEEGSKGKEGGADQQEGVESGKKQIGGTKKRKKEEEKMGKIEQKQQQSESNIVALGEIGKQFPTMEEAMMVNAEPKKGANGNNSSKVPLPSLLRTGLKRRLQESEDGYIRHMPMSMPTTSNASSSSLLPSKKVCHKEVQQEEGDEEEEGVEEETILKPPPAKRSKLQSVVNFFTNLFKW